MASQTPKPVPPVEELEHALVYANLLEPGRDPRSIFTEMFGTEYGWKRPSS